MVLLISLKVMILIIKLLQAMQQCVTHIANIHDNITSYRCSYTYSYSYHALLFIFCYTIILYIATEL